jgi:hypothetical protein
MVIVDDCSDESHRSMNEFSVSKTPFTYIYNHERKGIAGSKNVCLNALKHCEQVFLFDDDCYPQLAQWDVPFINLDKVFNIGHSSLNVLLPPPHNKIIASKNCVVDEIRSGYDVFNVGQGLCLFFTRKCLDAIGEYDEKFGIYGYEHSDMSNRAKEAGFCGQELTAYLSPTECSKYLYSLDLHHVFLNQNTLLGKISFKFAKSIHEDEPIQEYLDIATKNFHAKNTLKSNTSK